MCGCVWVCVMLYRYCSFVQQFFDIILKDLGSVGSVLCQHAIHVQLIKRMLEADIITVHTILKRKFISHFSRAYWYRVCLLLVQ